jgi:hypothetical protein
MTVWQTIGFVLTMVLLNLFSIVELRIWNKKKLWDIDRRLLVLEKQEEKREGNVNS